MCVCACVCVCVRVYVCVCVYNMFPRTSVMATRALVSGFPLSTFQRSWYILGFLLKIVCPYFVGERSHGEPGEARGWQISNSFEFAPVFATPCALNVPAFASGETLKSTFPSTCVRSFVEEGQRGQEQVGKSVQGRRPYSFSFRLYPSLFSSCVEAGGSRSLVRILCFATSGASLPGHEHFLNRPCCPSSSSYLDVYIQDIIY